MGQIILLVLAVFAAIVEVMVEGNRWRKMEYFDSRHHAVFRLDYQHRSWLAVLPALLVRLGASSFAASDTLLAWNKFVVRLRYRR